MRNYEALNYECVPIDANEFSNIHIQSMDYIISQYEVKGVGNLLIMTCPISETLQMDSFVITPYYKNLPLFSTDYMYMKERRAILNEFYDLSQKEDTLFQSYIDKFAAIRDKYAGLPDMPMKTCWYDDLRPVCTAKTVTPENDEDILELFRQNLKTYVEMEKALPLLTEEEYREKWMKTKDYTDGLVDRGGVSTDVFKQTMGEDKTKEFFNEVFFAPFRYRK